MEEEADSKFEYVVPRYGPIKPSSGYLVPKASKDAGGMLEEVRRIAKNPGPEQYHKSFLEKSFTKNALGGSFAKLDRETGKATVKKPAVGQYNIADVLPAKVKGGIMNKKERTCYFLDGLLKSEGKNSPGPNQYEAIIPNPQRVVSLKWNHAKTESRKTEKIQPVGPGHYSPNFAPTEKHLPNYSAPKDPSRSFLEQHLKVKENIPSPGTHSVAFTRVEDRSGRSKHAMRLLGDHIVTPRGLPSAPASAR